MPYEVNISPMSVERFRSVLTPQQLEEFEGAAGLPETYRWGV